MMKKLAAACLTLVILLGFASVLDCSFISTPPTSFTTVTITAGGDLTLTDPGGTVKQEDNATADANPASNITIEGANKTAGTGDGGDVIITPGTSTGGSTGIVRVESTLVGETTDFSVKNPDNTNVASHAKIETYVGGASGGDPHALYTVTGANQWYTGIDNSSDDDFVVGRGSTIGGDDWLRFDRDFDEVRVKKWFTCEEDIFAQGTDIGGTSIVNAENLDQTNAASHADLQVVTAHPNAGDPATKWRIYNGGKTWHMGVDNSDSDKLKIGDHMDVGTNTVMEFDASQISLEKYTEAHQDLWLWYSNPGVVVQFGTGNTDNTNAASNAEVQALTGGSSGGDPFFSLGIQGVQYWNIGIDNSDADTLKFGKGGVVASDPYMEFETADQISLEKYTESHDAFWVWTSTPGSNSEVGVANTSAAANSHAKVQMWVDNTAAGDPWASFFINGGTDYYLGTDNSDGDKFKIGAGNALGTNPYLTIDHSATQITLHDDVNVTGNVASTGILYSSVQTVNLTADDQVVTPTTSLIVLSSDDSTPANRTFTIADGGGGQILRLVFDDAVDRAELLTGAKMRLAGGVSWTPDNYDSLHLVWTTGGQGWVELSRSANT